MVATIQTPTLPPSIDIAAEYLRLVDGTKHLLDYAVAQLERKGKPGTDDLRNAIDLTSASLTTVQAHTAVAYAASQLDPRTVETLGSELRYINANLPSDNSFLLTDDANAEAAEDAKTGKDSLENLLGKWLPESLKNLLKVLNELLSLAFKV